MFHKNLKYTLIALTVLGATGCNQRTILIHPEDRRTSPMPRVESTVQQPVVREEILINKNPNLGDRVGVPANNPSLGTVISTESEHDKNIDSEIDKKDMEAEVVHDTIIPRMPFPVKEYARLRKKGRSTVTGTIYLENSNSSEKIIGQKVKVWLNPVTSYSEQWYQEDYLGGYRLSKIDKRIYNYMKLDYSTENGQFTFSGVPRGEYFLVSSVKCTEACGLPSNKKIRVVKRISVGSGVTKVNLMKNVP